MSQDPKTAAAAESESPKDEGKINITKEIQNIQKKLHEIDAAAGREAQLMLNNAAAAHASPGGEDVKVNGKTEAEWMEAFNQKSKEVGEAKASLEKQLTTLMQSAGTTQSPEERKKILKERAERANKAVQEPLKDLTAFAHPELDPIRSQLQSGPPPGGERSAVDDGTGGEVSTTEQEKERKVSKQS